ncbi:MAG: DNA-processing protein DprA [Bacteroidetes bacterium]|nr:DNA-processing protein DprA [Bacteroidota bacterium]
MNNLSLRDIADLRLLLSIEGIGPAKLLSLLRHFHNFESIFEKSISHLSEVNSFNTILSKRIMEAKENRENFLTNLSRDLEILQKLKARIITYWDDDYPELLRNIYFPPLILYVIGDLFNKDDLTLAVVGTRNPTEYGKLQADKFATDLSEKGLTIVSGLARGIDSIAHTAALNAGGRTIAVIGSGLDVIYPPENKKLFNRISESGCIISEFQLGTQPDAPNFPKRNRIIAGLSKGTLIIETKVSGGAVQTAAHSLSQNREVFAVPGQLGVPQSEGTNLLIQRGEAKLVSCAQDILDEFNYGGMDIKNVKKKPDFDLDMFQQKVIDNLSSDPKHVDILSTQTSIPTHECLAHLLQLEFMGLVKQVPGKMFIKIS